MKSAPFDLSPDSVGAKPDYPAYDFETPFDSPDYHPDDDVAAIEQAEQRASSERHSPIGGIIPDEAADDALAVHDVAPAVPADHVSIEPVIEPIDSKWNEPDDTPAAFTEYPEASDSSGFAVWENNEAPQDAEPSEGNGGFDGLDGPGDGGSDGPGDDETPDNPDDDEPNEDESEPSSNEADTSATRPNDDRVILDDSLELNVPTLEEMMTEMSDNHQTLKDIPLGKVGFMEIEEPEFGNSNEPLGTTRRFAERIRGLEQNEIMLCAGQFALMASGVRQSEADFKEIPAFAEGREHSGHGVVFGRLNIETMEYPPITTFVAMKPYDDRPKDNNLGARPAWSVAHDWATNQYLRRLSTSGAYEPIGVWRTDDTYFVPGLVTRFNERSLSLDNLLGDRAPVIDENGEIDIDMTQSRARRALHTGHFGLGIANGIRTTHGDAAPRNFATDGSHVIFNDVTTIQPFSTTRRKNEARAVEDMIKFVSMSIHPDLAPPEMRKLTGAALKEQEFRSALYGSYLVGVALGAERAGYSKSDGVMVPESTHEQIIDRFVQKYVPKA